MIITAAYCLWTLQRVFLGRLDEKYSTLPDITAREAIGLAPLGIMVVGLGVYPHPVLDLMKPTVGFLSGIIMGVRL